MRAINQEGRGGDGEIEGMITLVKKLSAKKLSAFSRRDVVIIVAVSEEAIGGQQEGSDSPSLADRFFADRFFADR